MVCIDKPLGWLATTRAERLLYGAALTGPSFVKYSQEFYRIVKQWTLNTPTFAWVRPFDRREDNRGAVAAMRAPYDGPGETAKQLSKSEANIKNLHYNNEHSLSFESFVNKLNEIFFIFSESEQPYTPVQKVKKMCEKMNTSNTTLQAAMTVIKMNPDLKTPINEYFTKTANTLAEQVAIISPMHEPKPPATYPLQTVDVVEDVYAVKITLEVEAKVEVVAHIKSNKLLLLRTWEATLAIHGMGSIYPT